MLAAAAVFVVLKVPKRTGIYVTGVPPGLSKVLCLLVPTFIEASCREISLPDFVNMDAVSSSALAWSLVTQLKSCSSAGRSRCCLCKRFECRLTIALLPVFVDARVLLLFCCLLAISTTAASQHRTYKYLARHPLNNIVGSKFDWQHG